MAINLKSTKDIALSGLKVLVYGSFGVGKTRLISTLPKPVVLSAESGLLSLSDYDLPYVAIDSMAALGEAYKWLTESKEAEAFESVALDSISEIAEVCLAHEKGSTKDPRQAYGMMQDKMAEVVRMFRDIPGKNVYMSAKMAQVQDDHGRLLYSASMPGKNAAVQLPYFFDEVFALRMEETDEGVMRKLQTQPCVSYGAKDRSGKLNKFEEPDLGAVIRKISSK